jgi:HD-GYP domain-containing protein (c-di-GMP phosphodiesterase class II)
MHVETLIFSTFIGGLTASLGLGSIYYRRLKKQVKKQSFQLNTIEQLYNEVQRASRTIDRNVLGSIEALVQALEARDSYTKGHSERVNKYSMAIGRRLGLSEHALEILHDASLLHDIGKIGVYDRILLKPASLNAEEFALMKSHPDLAAGILSSLSFLEEHLPLIQHHHERQDGSGYPLGLKGDEIPLGARIIQVADTWDAMTSDRPYRRRMSTEVAVAELIKAANTQLDKDCVEAFIEWLKETGRLQNSASAKSSIQPTTVAPYEIVT